MSSYFSNNLTSAQQTEADNLLALLRSFPPDAQKTVSGIIAGFRAGMDYQTAHMDAQRPAGA